MRLLFVFVVMAILSGCFTGCQEVRVLKYGCGDVNVYLDKPVSTLPFDLKARDVQVPLTP